MFTGNENQQVTLTEASQLTANYRTAHPGALLGHYFGREILQTILSQADCVGIRVYYANNSEGGKELVIVGVKANEDDLFHGIIGDRSLKSPPHTGIANPLNT